MGNGSTGFRCYGWLHGNSKRSLSFASDFLSTLARLRYLFTLSSRMCSRSFDPFASTDYRSRDLNAVGENGWLAYPYPRGSSWMHMDEMRPVTTALLYPKDSSWSNFDKFVQARTQVEKGFGLEDAKKMKREKVIVRAEFLATDPHIEVQQPETWSKEKKKWFLTHRKDRLRDAFWEKSGRRIKGSPVYDVSFLGDCSLERC